MHIFRSQILAWIAIVMCKNAFAQGLDIDAEAVNNEGMSDFIVAVDEFLPHLNNQEKATVPTCIPAKWISTQVPTFRGLEITFKMIKTKIAPDSPCEVIRNIERMPVVDATIAAGITKIKFPVEAKYSASTDSFGAVSVGNKNSLSGMATLTIDASNRTSGQLDSTYTISWDEPIGAQLPSGVSIDNLFGQGNLNDYLGSIDASGIAEEANRHALDTERDVQ